MVNAEQKENLKASGLINPEEIDAEALIEPNIDITEECKKNGIAQRMFDDIKKKYNISGTVDDCTFTLKILTSLEPKRLIIDITYSIADEKEKKTTSFGVGSIREKEGESSGIDFDEYFGLPDSGPLNADQQGFIEDKRGEIKDQKPTETTTTVTTDNTDKKLGVTTGFNSIETALTDEGSARIRGYADVGLTYKIAPKKTLELQLTGMNQFTENLKSYFGRNEATLGLKDKDLKLIGVVKTTADGVIDTKYGLRYLISDKLGIDYGRVDISANKDGGDATFFLGKTLGEKKKGSVELFESAGIDLKGKITPYTELQLNKEVMGGLNVFVRGEVPGVNFKDATYLLGISKKL